MRKTCLTALEIHRDLSQPGGSQPAFLFALYVPSSSQPVRFPKNLICLTHPPRTVSFSSLKFRNCRSSPWSAGSPSSVPGQAEHRCRSWVHTLLTDLPPAPVPFSFPVSASSALTCVLGCLSAVDEDSSGLVVWRQGCHDLVTPLTPAASSIFPTTHPSPRVPSIHCFSNYQQAYPLPSSGSLFLPTGRLFLTTPPFTSSSFSSMNSSLIPPFESDRCVL